jgi:hypothetical protein
MPVPAAVTPDPAGPHVPIGNQAAARAEIAADSAFFGGGGKKPAIHRRQV